MGKHNFGYFLHEGVSNMFSHGFLGRNWHYSGLPADYGNVHPGGCQR